MCFFNDVNQKIYVGHERVEFDVILSFVKLGKLEVNLLFQEAKLNDGGLCFWERDRNTLSIDLNIHK